MQENFPQDKMLVSRWPDQWWVRAWKSGGGILTLAMFLSMALIAAPLIYIAWLQEGSPRNWALIWDPDPHPVQRFVTDAPPIAAPAPSEVQGSDQRPFLQGVLPALQQTLALPSARWLIWIMVLVVGTRAVQIFLPIVLDLLRATRARDPHPAWAERSMIFSLLLLVLILATRS